MSNMLRRPIALAAMALLGFAPSSAIAAGASPGNPITAPAVLTYPAVIASPPPAPGTLLAPPISLRTGVLPAPSQPHYTTNIGTCKANGGDDNACSLLRDGAVAFYWSFSCGGSCTIAGFKLRSQTRAIATERRFDAIQSRGIGIGLDEPQTATPIIVMPATGTEWSGQCYTVVAFRTPLRTLAPDGGGGMRPTTTMFGSNDESAPSPRICVNQTKTVTKLAVSTARGYSRFAWVLYGDNQPHEQDQPVTSSTGSIEVGTFFMPTTNFSQYNRFYRVAVAFDRSAIANDTIFGGSFAYDFSGPSANSPYGCANLFNPAPGGWMNATWPLPSGTPLDDYPKIFSKAGSTLSFPIDDLLKKWTSKSMTFFLLERNQEEFVKSGLEAVQFSCGGQIANVRLETITGVDR